MYVTAQKVEGFGEKLRGFFSTFVAEVGTAHLGKKFKNIFFNLIFLNLNKKKN